MDNFFMITLIVSLIAIWYFSKKNKNKKNRNIAIFLSIISFILVGLTAKPEKEEKKIETKPKVESVAKKQLTDKQAKEFALYFKDKAYIEDSGKKVEFIVGADKDNISARVGESYKNKSVVQKTYLGNEFLKQKNHLFNEWTKSEKLKIKQSPELILTVSDSDHTIIAQEINEKMKVINSN
ncbi:Uncharacterised protein [Streptococcus pseudoporcinus]|uniref:Uncharacterized protein n=1 Tax=Streptococcus pseudoporcinus TaxID=361101 RepID=A0A4U9XNQ6_9STRE|nr:hypothetical protein [Streptococcus pseudoporcinus]VTS14719.1 Uncharacterised protein [Streptococcus pseudoporcinus]